MTYYQRLKPKPMILQNFKPFIGQHCETTATGSLLNQLGIDLSEPMLFGLGEGLGFLFWRMKIMDFPFIGGRVKTDKLTENICRNLNLILNVKETSSVKKAWKNIEEPIATGKAVGIKLDCYHLEYFSSKIHFAGHYATLYGYDSEYAYLIDTHQQGCQVKTKLKNFELARNEKGPMSSRNLSFTIEQVEDLPDLKDVIKTAILNNANDFLNPPIKNLGYKGIKKTATEIKKWFATSNDIKGEFQTSAMLMERAGTGGALFRNLYRDFLEESSSLLKAKAIDVAHSEFVNHAHSWTELSNLFMMIGETQDEKYLEMASKLFIHLSVKEKETMEVLRNGLQ